MRFRGILLGMATAAVTLVAQDTTAPAIPARDLHTQGQRAGEFVIDAGTKVPLSLINSISTKHSAEGDRIYLETVFPIMSNGRIVIPPGSYVAGTVTFVKRPGRVKGRGELFLRFDSLTLPNGVTRDFRARIGSMDGRASEEFDRTEGKISSEGNKGGDARCRRFGRRDRGRGQRTLRHGYRDRSRCGSRCRTHGRAADAWARCRAVQGEHHRNGSGSSPALPGHRADVRAGAGRAGFRQRSAAGQKRIRGTADPPLPVLTRRLATSV